MRKATVLVAAIAATLVITSFSSAQMDTKMGPKGATANEHMMGDMSSLMNDMSGMMMRMTGMMKDMNPGKKKKMADLMKGLSKEMMNMSNMMGSGMMSDREIEKMRVRLAKMEKMMSEMDAKK